MSNWWDNNDRDARKGRKQPDDALQTYVVIASWVLALFMLAMIAYMLSVTPSKSAERISLTERDTTPQTIAACNDGSDRRILVINKASKRMTILSASPVDNPKWTYNMLQGKVLRPGESIMADIDDGTCYCLYDMMAQLADGRTAVKESANVCTGTSWVITD